MRRIVMFVAMSVLASLALVGVARAQPPSIATYPVTETNTYAAGQVCAFAVKVVVSETVTDMTFSGTTGVRVTTHVRGGSVSTNLSTGRQMHETWSFTARDLTFGYGEWTGMQDKLRGPDGHLAWLQAGRYVVSAGILEQQAGRWDVVSQAAWCAALTG